MCVSTCMYTYRQLRRQFFLNIEIQAKKKPQRIYYDIMNVKFKTHKSIYFITYACEQVYMW